MAIRRLTALVNRGPGQQMIFLFCKEMPLIHGQHEAFEDNDILYLAAR